MPKMPEKPDAEGETGMSEKPELCYRCGNPIAPWQSSIRRLVGANIDVRHANPADHKPTKKPKEENRNAHD